MDTPEPKSTIHPSTQAWLDLFNFAPIEGHYRIQMERVREVFKDLAKYIVEIVPNNNQQTVALSKLMEAKDAAVRAIVLEASGSRGSISSGS